MISVERKISVLCDIDGTLNRAPFPVKTTFRLLKGHLDLPPQGWPLQEAQSKSGATEKFSVFWHAIRPFTQDSKYGLDIFKRLAEQSEGKIKLAVVSGREQHLHKLTMLQLLKTGRLDYFEEFHLSNVNSSSGWKEQKVREEVEQGSSVVLIEDDLFAALRVARISNCFSGKPQVLVYLLKNFSNHPLLLKRAKIKLPENVVPVQHFSEAAKDFRQRIVQEEF